MKVFRRYLLQTAAVCAVTLIAGCAAHEVNTQKTPAEPFSGHVSVSADGGAWFTRCGDAAGSKLWVTFTEKSVEQAQRAKAAGLLGSDPTFVRWMASRTDGRQVGPGGPALLVRDIAEVRAPRADDCR
jgi:invasion protein IalB